MKPDDTKEWVSISLRPTHGTARKISRPSVIPPDKADKEVFWVKILVDCLPEFSSGVEGVVSNPDDSHGQHDVLINLREGKDIGVQVTELTSELRRRREAMRKGRLHRCGLGRSQKGTQPGSRRFRLARSQGCRSLDSLEGVPPGAS